MHNSHLSTLFTLVMLTLLLAGCGDVIPIWMQDKGIENYTLSYTSPCEMNILIRPQDAGKDLRMEFQIHYDRGIGRVDLPLFLVIEDAEHNVQEYNTTIPLKMGDEWLGAPSENEVDLIITHEAIPTITFTEGTYSMKIYANDKGNEKVRGVVRIVARLYESEMISEP